MMPPEKKGGGGGVGGGGVRRGAIDLLLLYRDTRKVLSDPPHSLSLSFPPLKSVFSLTVYPSLPAGLVSFPKPLGWSFL